MDILDYVAGSRTILIPVLYIIGYIIKNTELIKNKYIPLILLIVSVTLSILMGENTVINNIIQGILAAGATVLTNQLIKQSKKPE